jgi:hypothetical protein
MKIVQTYSHLNGLEYLLVHKKKLWNEVRLVIQSVDGNACKTKVSKEKTMSGELLYSPIDMNGLFTDLLAARNWSESRVSYWVTKSERLIRQTLIMKVNFIISSETVAGFPLSPWCWLGSNHSRQFSQYEGNTNTEVIQNLLTNMMMPDEGPNQFPGANSL